MPQPQQQIKRDRSRENTPQMIYSPDIGASLQDDFLEDGMDRLNHNMVTTPLIEN